MWFGCDVHIFLFAFVLFKKRQEIEQKVMAEKPTIMKETTIYSYPFSMRAYWMLAQWEHYSSSLLMHKHLDRMDFIYIKILLGKEPFMVGK